MMALEKVAEQLSLKLWLLYLIPSHVIAVGLLGNWLAFAVYSIPHYMLTQCFSSQLTLRGEKKAALWQIVGSLSDWRSLNNYPIHLTTGWLENSESWKSTYIKVVKLGKHCRKFSWTFQALEELKIIDLGRLSACHNSGFCSGFSWKLISPYRIHLSAQVLIQDK